MFFHVPRDVYESDEIWTPESEGTILQKFKDAESSDRMKMHPLLALRDGSPVGRAVAILQSDNKITERKQGWIGYFEALKNQKTAVKLLFEKCEEIFQGNQISFILGPKVDNILVGLLVKGFNLPQTIMTNYNPPYYKKYFKKNGYKTKTNIYSFYYSRSKINIENMTKKIYEAVDTTIITREFDPNNLENEILIFHELNNSIFVGQDDYVERTLAEDRALINSLLPIIDKEMIIIAEDSEKNAIGMLICIPDANQHMKEGKIDRVRIITIGVLPKWHRMGVGLAMGRHIMDNLIKKPHVQTAEASFILSHNLPPQILARKFHAKSGRKFTLFHKKLT